MKKYHNGRFYGTVVATKAEPVTLARPVEKECEMYYCKRIEQPGCCLYCPAFLSCNSACINSPEKCGLLIND